MKKVIWVWAVMALLIVGKSYCQSDHQASDDNIQAFCKFLQKNIKYPQSAKEFNFQGKVLIDFEIEKGGKISNVKVLRSPIGQCDSAVKQNLKNNPFNIKLIPGQYKLVVNFELMEEDDYIKNSRLDNFAIDGHLLYVCIPDKYPVTKVSVTYY